MKALKLILILLIIITVNPLFSQSEVNQYLKTAAENNPGLKAKFNNYLAALEVVPQVGALPDPKIAFGYFIQPIETRLGPQQAKISLSQMFPWFGTLNALENSSIAMAKSKYEDFEEAKAKLFFDIKSTYYNLYFAKKAISISDKNIRLLESLKKLARVKYESGVVSAVDLYRIEIELNELEYQRGLLEDNLSFLKVKFNNFLNAEAGTPILIQDTLISTAIILSKKAILDSILLRNNKLASFDYQLESFDYKVQTAKKLGMPQLTVGVEYAFIGSGNSTASDAGKDAIVFPQIGFSLPIYRNKYKAMIDEVNYLKQSKQYEKDENVNMLETLFELNWKEYSDASNRLELYIKQTELAEKSLSILTLDYQKSNGNFEEILRMERKLLKFSLEMQKAATDIAASKAFIDYLMGQ